MHSNDDAEEEEDTIVGSSTPHTRRRHFLAGAMLPVLIAAPQLAGAGIDVSGLRQEGGGGGSGGNSILKEQLKQIDGSASARVTQIKELSSSSSSIAGSPASASQPEEILAPTIATWLYRSNPTVSPRLSRTGMLKNLYRCEDTVIGPASTSASASTSAIGISFEFPLDWLQLDKYLGGISYVDQRNGARLYVLRTQLPDGERLATVPKAFFGTSIFDPNGTIVKSQGIDVDEYKVASVTTLNECPQDSCATHKRYKIKYTTVTGNGLRVERRALVDAYELSPRGDVYLMMTSSNAVDFENKEGAERKTVEAIVDSFRINV